MNSEISRVEIVGPDADLLVAGSESDIKETLKSRELETRKAISLKESIARIKPVHSKLGPTFRKDAKEIAEKLSSASGTDIGPSGIEMNMADGRAIVVAPEFYEIEKKMTSDKGALEHISAGGLSILIYQ